MGPREAAYAMKLLKVPAMIPAHFATFPVLTGTPGALREALAEFGAGSVEVVVMTPGETVR
jgi:L-ascorbate metabolism protein UlaG (beta-lactamase superfamily)